MQTDQRGGGQEDEVLERTTSTCSRISTNQGGGWQEDEVLDERCLCSPRRGVLVKEREE